MTPEARQFCLSAGELLNVSAVEIASPLRGSPEAARARQVAIWLMYKAREPITWTALGEAFGRDRTTVRHAVFEVTLRIERGELSKDLERLSQ